MLDENKATGTRITDRVEAAKLSLRWSWRFAGASVPLAVLALLTTFPLMMVGSCFAWIAGLIAIIIGLQVLVRSVRVRWQSRRSPPAVVPPQAHMWARVLGCLIVLLVLQLALTFLNLLAFAAVREASVATVSKANLMGLGNGVALYGEEHGCYAPEMKTFVDIGFSTHKSFVSPFDVHKPREWNDGDPLYSSYVYTPGRGIPASDPLLVIAYEREAFSSNDARIFRKGKRFVLFGDGRVQHLDDSHFEAALDADRRRRQELGWLSPESSPATSSPVR